MNLPLSPLRHTVKEILACALHDLFPGVILLGGGVDQVLFYYDFISGSQLPHPKELQVIEDRMRQLIFEDLPIKQLEMMRENAATFLNHLGLTERAQTALDESRNIVSLIEIGPFRDPCPPPYLEKTGECKHFHLFGIETLGGGVCRIKGTAFHTKSELKIYLKRHRVAEKSDAEHVGPKRGYFLPFDGEWIYLEKGEELIHRFSEFWRKRHLEEGYTLLKPLEGSPLKQFHLSFLSRSSHKKIASMGPDGDLATACYKENQELFDLIISSLQFFEEAFKIFAFDTQVLCYEQEGGPMAALLEKSNFCFERKKPSAEGAKLVFQTSDGYGRDTPLSIIQLGEGVFHRTCFIAWKPWIAQCIQRGDKD